MNVNFGSLRFDYEIIPNRKQNMVLRCIERELYPENTDVANTKLKNKLHNITNLLEDKKNADIFVQLNEDGNVNIKVEKDCATANGTKKYVPYSTIDSSPLKLTIDSNRRKGAILKQLREFADKCYWYAIEADSRKNRLIEQSAKYNL